MFKNNFSKKKQLCFKIGLKRNVVKICIILALDYINNYPTAKTLKPCLIKS